LLLAFASLPQTFLLYVRPSARISLNREFISNRTGVALLLVIHFELDWPSAPCDFTRSNPPRPRASKASSTSVRRQSARKPNASNKVLFPVPFLPMTAVIGVSGSGCCRLNTLPRGNVLQCTKIPYSDAFDPCHLALSCWWIRRLHRLIHITALLGTAFAADGLLNRL
jgi:hypothetical protein